MRLWLGVLGAPAAWTAQHVTGYALTEAACGRAGWDVHMDAWTVAVTAAAALVALASGTAAALTYRATRATESSEPPAARIRFLAVIGMAIAPLFLAMILMSGLGSVLLVECRQG